MLTKPDGCRGCSFYQDGQGFVPDEVRARASVYILGQNPGREEESQGTPFVGRTGQMLERKYLPLAGVTREDVSLGNVIRCRWKGGNELPPLTQRVVRDTIEHCQHAHFKIPEGTRVIVTQGDYALWGLTGETSSTEWRGYTLSPYLERRHVSEVWIPNGDACVLSTVHLARLFREPTLTLATMSDWGKVQRLLKRTWPQPPPPFLTGPPEAWPARFSFDTEFPREYPRKLIRYSMYDGRDVRVVEARDHRVPRFMVNSIEAVAQTGNTKLGTPSKTTGGVIERRIVPVIERRVPEVAGILSPASLNKSTVISQYAPADMAHLARLSKRDVWEAFTVDDTVWKHAVLYSDHPHDLNYLGSLYSSMNRWKHLSDTAPKLYAGADAYGTWEVDQALEKELEHDLRSRQVYEQIDRPVLPDFVRAQYRGIRTDQNRISAVIHMLSKEREDAQARARAICGWPLNVGSPQQVAHRLYKVERLGAPQACS